MRVARGVLLLGGVLMLGLGALVLLDTQRPDQILGVAVWLLGAIVLHDAVLSPLLLVANLLLRRRGRRVPAVVLAIVQVAVVVGAVLALLVVPEIYARSLNPANPTILVGDYALRLALLWAALALLTALTVVGYLVGRGRLLRSRQKVRPSRAQV